MFEKITVLGVGLIGASFSLAMKKAGLCGKVTGFGRNRENLKKAAERGIIDSFEADPASACAGSDLVLFSTPVGSFLDLARQASSSFKKGAIVTDAGSVKGGLVYEMEKMLPEGVYYIGAHPIAGSDRSGLDSARSDLFRNARCILTPTERSDPGALGKVMEMWRSLGSVVMTLGPEEHDRIYASVSHMPHMIAYALVNTVADVDPSYLGFSGQGFRDMTRIASSSPELWRDICRLNRENLMEMLTLFQKNLDSLGRYLRDFDSDSLEGEFRKARTLREGLGRD